MNWGVWVGRKRLFHISTMVGVYGRHVSATFLRGIAIDLGSLGEMPWVALLLHAMSYQHFPEPVIDTCAHAGLWYRIRVFIFLNSVGGLTLSWGRDGAFQFPPLIKDLLIDFF